MANYKIMLNEHLEDLNPVCGGEARCRPGAVDFPFLHTIMLHYVVSGCGTLTVNGQDYPVQAGQAFVLPTDVRAKFTADLVNPWHMRWIGFTGSLASDFLKLPPVFDAPEDTLCHMQGHKEQNFPPMLAYQLAGDLYQLYAAVIPAKKLPQNHIQRSIDFIEINYMRRLAVQDVAEYVGLNPSYLSKLFKQKTGHTLQHHILSIRLSESKRCLRLGYSVKESANLCGFQDIANFSKLFKREFGRSPTNWRTWAQGLKK